MIELKRSLDVLAIGRSSIDLYANEIGAPFVDIKSFAAYVGGCPTNICVGTNRLGLRTALLNVLGADLVGDFVQNFLERENISTRFSVRKAGRRTSAFLLGIEPPAKFSIVPYRDNPADLELTIEDVLRAPIADARLLLVTGTGLSRQPSQAATLYAAEQARAHNTKVMLDLDFRAELWADVRAYGTAMRAALPLVDVVLGTHEEISFAFTDDATNANDVNAFGLHTNRDAKHETNQSLENGIAAALSSGVEALVMKRGAESTLIYLPGNSGDNGDAIEAATFPVEVLNVLGAGDAFASGFIYGYLKSWDWHKCARMGNACGAILVTRHGCANFMPYEHEVLSFIENRGGF